MIFYHILRTKLFLPLPRFAIDHNLQAKIRHSVRYERYGNDETRLIKYITMWKGASIENWKEVDINCMIGIKTRDRAKIAASRKKNFLITLRWISCRRNTGAHTHITVTTMNGNVYAIKRVAVNKWNQLKSDANKNSEMWKCVFNNNNDK